MLKTDSEFLFLVLYSLPPPSLGTTESFGRDDDDVWAGKSNGSGRYGGTYRALSAECHAIVELAKGPGQAVAFQSQRRKHPMGLQWLVLLWIIRRDYSGEALGDTSKASLQGKMTDDGVPGERKANAFLYDLTLDYTHTQTGACLS